MRSCSDAPFPSQGRPRRELERSERKIDADLGVDVGNTGWLIMIMDWGLDPALSKLW